MATIEAVSPLVRQQLGRHLTVVVGGGGGVVLVEVAVVVAAEAETVMAIIEAVLALV